VEEIESSVQGYYDDPNALNFHMQVQWVTAVLLLADLALLVPAPVSVMSDLLRTGEEDRPACLPDCGAVRVRSAFCVEE